MLIVPDEERSNGMRNQLEGLPVMSEEGVILNTLLNATDEMSDDDDMPDEMRKQLEGFPVMSE